MKLSFRAIARLENIFGTTVAKWDLQNINFTDIANILTEANRAEHPEITVDTVIDLIDQYSNPQDAIKKAYECIAAAFGKAETSVGE